MEFKAFYWANKFEIKLAIKINKKIKQIIMYYLMILDFKSKL